MVTNALYLASKYSILIPWFPYQKYRTDLVQFGHQFPTSLFSNSGIWYIVGVVVTFICFYLNKLSSEKG